MHKLDTTRYDNLFTYFINKRLITITPIAFNGKLNLSCLFYWLSRTLIFNIKLNPR